MLLLQKPTDVSKYICIKSLDLTLYLQKKGYHPRYYYDGCHYYDETEQLKDDIILYNVKQNESEVSKFGKSL